MKTIFTQFFPPSSLRLWLFYFWSGLLCLPALSPAAAQSVYPAPYTFTTLTNILCRDDTNGAHGSSWLRHSRGLAVDAAGNIYFANTYNHTVCRLTTTGILTVLAGAPDTPGSADGAGGSARFYFPQGVALDDTGNLYVADSGNDTIRRVTPAGQVTTVAGVARQVGSADGKGGQARFNYPKSVAVDNAGNVFVADLFNSTIRKVSPDGIVTTLAGCAEMDGYADGLGSAARFKFPFSVAVGNGGDVYVLDMFSGVRKITHSGQVSTLAGRDTYSVGSADGRGGTAQFNHPSALAVDAIENVYVADTANDTIRRIARDGSVTTLAGTAGMAGEMDGDGDAARFDHPAGIALDRKGNLYVSDMGSGQFRKGIPAKQLAIDNRPQAGRGLSFANP